MEPRIRPYRPGEEEYAADLHERIYTEEYGWNRVFLDYAVSIPRNFAKREKSTREELYIAEKDGRPVGCILLCGTEDPEVGQLRVFAVERDCRRQGIGAALLRAAMEKAESAGYGKLILWTADAAADALRKYRQLGFRTVETAENRSWTPAGEVVNEMKMELALSPGASLPGARKGENKMIVLNVSYKCRPDMREEFLERIWAEGIDAASRAEAGNLKYDYYLPAEGGDELLLVEKWRDEEALAEHRAQTHFAKLGQLKAEYVYDTVIERYEVQE